MKSLTHQTFDKDYKKLTPKVKEQFKVRMNIFLVESFHPILNNHKLYGKYAGCRTINITGDYRAIYYMKGEIAVFIHIGTHPELYS
jgi:addiction module RelE/StbE family toxin